MTGISGGVVGGTSTSSLGGSNSSGAGDGTPIGSGKGVSPGCGGRPGAGLGSAGVGSGKGWLGKGMLGTRHSPKVNGSARSAANRRPFLSCRSSRALIGAALRLSGDCPGLLRLNLAIAAGSAGRGDHRCGARIRIRRACLAHFRSNVAWWPDHAAGAVQPIAQGLAWPGVGLRRAGILRAGWCRSGLGRCANRCGERAHGRQPEQGACGRPAAPLHPSRPCGRIGSSHGFGAFQV